MILVLAVACAPPPRETPDAAPDAQEPFCGDGIYEPARDEQCDDGDRNGTGLSHCTKQCRERLDALGIPGAWYVDFGFPIAKLDHLGIDPGSFHRYAATNFDYRGIVVARGIQAGTTPPTPELVSLRVAHDPISMGRLRTTASLTHRWPAWIERGPEGPTKLYYAEVYATGAPTIHEVPYPFPDGIQPELVSRTWYNAGLLIADRAGDGTDDLLIAYVVVRPPDDVRVYRGRFAAPGGSRGLAYDTGWYYASEQKGHIRQLVQFYDESATYVTVDVIGEDSDMFATRGIAFTERGRGTWPRRVIAADMFSKGCSSDLGGVDPAFRDPTPLAVVSDKGEIFVAPFDGANYGGGESFLTPFAVVEGAQSVMGESDALVTWAPSGDVITFYDGDCARADSVGLAPVSRRVMPPWTRATQQTGLQLLSPVGYWGTADSRMY